jgi:hypothetical protein
MNTTLRILPLAILFALLSLPAPARSADEDTPLGNAMDAIAKAYKALGTELKAPDAARKDAYAKLAGTIQDEAVKSIDLVPAKIAALPESERAKLLDAYKADMKKFAATAGDLKSAVADAKWADADALMKALKKDKASGHEQFKLEE